MARLTLTDNKGKNYPVKITDGAALVECNRQTGEVTCPLDTTAEELDSFANALARAPVGVPAFRQYPLIRDPVN